jgi:hypothetical protein
MANCYSYEDMFSEINSLKYINLYSFKNDRIISSIFNDINSTIFVCQKNKIIINSKAYNCCDSNLEPYNCISSNSENTIPSNNDESNNSETDTIINHIMVIQIIQKLIAIINQIMMIQMLII